MKRTETLCATVHDASGKRQVFISGRQVCRTLRALINAGPKGVTALELSSWAFRLAHYVFLLKRDHNLAIVTEHEAHDGGYHGRYRLLLEVTIHTETEAAA